MSNDTSGAFALQIATELVQVSLNLTRELLEHDLLDPKRAARIGEAFARYAEIADQLQIAAGQDGLPIADTMAVRAFAAQLSKRG